MNKGFSYILRNNIQAEAEARKDCQQNSCTSISAIRAGELQNA